MKCLECGEQTKGRDHNKRGLRCTACWALLPDKPDPPERRVLEPESPPKPKRRRKASAEMAIAKGSISSE